MISERQTNLRIDSEQIKRIIFTALNVKRVDQMVRYKLYRITILPIQKSKLFVDRSTQHVIKSASNILQRQSMFAYMSNSYSIRIHE